jgi:hypothetical protein
MDTKLAAPPPASIPELAPAQPPRMAPTGDVVTIRLAVHGKAQPFPCPAPLPVRTTAPVAMPLRIVAKEPSPRSAPPIRGIENRAAAAQMRRRILSDAWRCTTKPVLGSPLKRVAPPQACPVAGNARPSAAGTAAAAAKGRALRVSLAAGFRIPEWKLRPQLLAGPAAAAMVWPGPRTLRAGLFRAPAATETPAGISPAEMLSAPQMRIPASPPPVFLAVFRWPEVKGISLNSSRPAVLHRSAIVPFNTNEEYSPKERPYEYRN